MLLDYDVSGIKGEEGKFTKKINDSWTRLK